MTETAIPLPPVASWSLDAFVVAARWTGADTAAAFALADGTVLIADRARPPSVRHVRTGAAQILAMTPVGADAFVVATDTGALLRIDASGTVHPFAAYPDAWIDVLATDGRGTVAVAVNRTVVLLRADGTEAGRTPEHESTVGGLAFSADGSRIVASHYGGATIWKVAELPAPPRRLRFAGSHLDVTVSANARFLATTTQEKEVHVWRLRENRDMRMSGYYAKPRSLSWSSDGAWLVTSGGDAGTAWPFSGPGPEGQAPRLVGPVSESLVTAVACHPGAPLVALGYGEGTVVLASLTGRTLEVPIVDGSGKAVTTLAWSCDGRLLVAGTRDGQASLVYVDD